MALVRPCSLNCTMKVQTINTNTVDMHGNSLKQALVVVSAFNACFGDVYA
jgi:hypothetical protein